jgi:hypothetical protein
MLAVSAGEGHQAWWSGTFGDRDGTVARAEVDTDLCTRHRVI